MSDFNVSYNCGDYPTNELSCSERKRNTHDEKLYEQEMRAKGYLQDSTGCWYNPKSRFIYDLDW